MDLDAKVCYCFHISQRKLLNFIRLYRPKVPSQLSECGGSGTGCGWCIPFLKQLHQQAVQGGETELERLTPEEYEQRRAAYVRAGKGKPPPGAADKPDPSAPPTPALVRQAVERSLSFLEKEGVAWLEEHKCASCHAVPMAIWSLSEARQRGLAVNQKVLDDVKARALAEYTG